MPNIYADGKTRNLRHKRNTSPGRRHPENLFIYKDFDTSLTKVKVAVGKLAPVNKTTSKRGEDLIRDRLLSFNVKNGNLSETRNDGRARAHTINERSDVVAKKRKIQE